ADLAAVEGQLPALHAPELHALHEDLAPGRLLLPDQEADHRRFAGPRRAHQEEEVAFGDDDVDVPKRLRASRVLLPNVLEADDRPSCKIRCQKHWAGSLAVTFCAGGRNG